MQGQQVADSVFCAGGGTARHGRCEDVALPFAQGFQVLPDPRLLRRRAGKLRHIAEFLTHYIISIPPRWGWFSSENVGAFSLFSRNP